MRAATTKPDMLGLPGPGVLEMVAALPRIRRFAPDFLVECANRYGSLVSFPVPGTPTVLAACPQAAWQVLVQNNSDYGKDTPQYVSLSALTGSGLLTSDGDLWRRRRRRLQPAFARGGLPAVAHQAAAAAAQAAGRVGPNGLIDAEEMMLTASLSVVAETLLGSQLQVHGEALIRAILDGLDVVVASVARPVPALLAGKRRARMQAAQQALDDATEELIAGRRAETASAGPDGAADAGPDEPRPEDLLDRLLAALEDGSISRQGVRDELVTTVIAGHETVGSAMTWTLHLLSERRQIQQQGAAQVREALCGTPIDHWPHWLAEHYAELDSLRMICDEALRLYPPAWVITRRAHTATVLRSATRSVSLPAGSLVIISPWQLHRDPAVYPDPEVFDPDRFQRAAAARPSGSYLPFGAGPRLCIGRDMARVESVAALAVLLARFDILPVGRAPRPEALVTLRPHGGLRLRMGPVHCSTSTG